MQLFLRHRFMLSIGLIVLILTGGCALHRLITTDPHSKSHLGPDSSALVILDARIFGNEVPAPQWAETKPIMESILDALWAELWGLSDDSEELREYALEPEGGVLAANPSGKTLPAIVTKGHLVFMDVPPGVIQLSSIRGYRRITLDGEKLYGCSDDTSSTSQCPRIWVYAYPMEAVGLADLSDSVSAGEILYLGRLDVAGLYPEPPYGNTCRATTESNSFLGTYNYTSTYGDCWTVDVGKAEMSSTVHEQKLALKDVHDRIKNKEWQKVLKAALAKLETQDVSGAP